MKRLVRLASGRAERRLDDALAAWLPKALGHPVSKAQVRKLIVVGAVRADGRVERRPARAVAPGTRIEVAVRTEALAAPPEQATPAELGTSAILYEDADLIAIDKPAGLQFHPTADHARASLVSLVERLLAGRAGRGGPGLQLGVHQRLDRDTSGVVLFAKTPAANRGLARAFQGREVEKTYLALTRRPARLPPERWTARGPLQPAGPGRRSRSRVVQTGGLPAETEFRRLAVLARALLVEARPRTGRKHQVRAHLAHAGMPILGDVRYGGQARLAGLRLPRVLLHARRLRLPHPVSGAALVIESRVPSDFARILDALHA